MSFERENRWEEFLAALHLLQLRHYTGVFTVGMQDGVVTRGTLRGVQHLARLVAEVGGEPEEIASCRNP